jgi:hypothetical protein
MESQERLPKEIHGDNGTGTIAELQSEGNKKAKKKERLLDFLRATPPNGSAFLARAASLRTRAATMHAAVYVDWHGVRTSGRGTR